MRTRDRKVRRLRSFLREFEALEARLVLTSPGNLTIPLDPTFDQFGDQIITIQAYEDPTKAAFGIFDTGASAVTFSADDQAIFADAGGAIPVKVPGGAAAPGLGGGIRGQGPRAGPTPPA